MKARIHHRGRPTAAVAVAAVVACGFILAPPAQAKEDAASSFSSSFEIKDNAPKTSTPFTGPVNLTGPMSAVVDSGPTSTWNSKSGVGFTGLRALEYAGTHAADKPASATDLIFDDVDVAVQPDTEFSYKIFPQYDSTMTYAATYVALDLVFSDGTRLSQTSATDANGFPANAKEQGVAKALSTNQWNSVQVPLGQFAGKTVTKVLLAYDNPNATTKAGFTGWVDDVSLAPATPRDTSDGKVSYVDTRRGTLSSGTFSRGNTQPMTAVPNGFNFFTPMTNGDSQDWEYNYQESNDDDHNLPMLQAIGISHEPSTWMGDRDQLAFMPSESTDPDASPSGRALEYSHANEIGRPDLYQVKFTDGITAAVTPTDHAAVMRFTYPGDTGSLIVDRVSSGSDKFSISADGVLSGWTENGSGLSTGRSRMFFYGKFDRTPTKAGDAARGGRASAKLAVFDTSSDKTVELRVATSFISLDQARKNLNQEVTGVSFDDVRAKAISAWNDRLGVIDVQGATDNQLVTLYSSLYRLNLYPNSQFENTGSVSSPVYKYASPVAPQKGSATDTTTNAQIVDGKVYVNNGFWDTYRTAWPAYSFFYPDKAAELADGFVQQYRDGGWVARWSSPGYADLMTGTSSDVSFAEAYMTGALPTDKALDAFDAAVKNATVLPTSNGVGRKGLDSSIFLGYTPSSTGESVSWGLEGFINDFGISQMAAKLAADPKTPQGRVAQLKVQADYFAARAKGYVNMFNKDAGFFTTRDANGNFADPKTFDPTAWWGAYTETNGWNFSFHAPFDVDGLAALYGGTDGLLKKLDEFFATPETSQGSIHEETEAREVRMGELGMSNQVSHHIPYMYAAAGEPSKTQEKVREILSRLFVGSDIGQGYFGDEDNGEMSAWFLFSSLGFYPLQVGSGNYTIGSPLFEKATIHRPNGKDLTITAPGTSKGEKYVAGVKLDGKKLNSVSVNGDQLRSATKLAFTMSDQPSSWGTRSSNEPVPETMMDATSAGNGTITGPDGVDVGALTDNSSRTTADLDAGGQVTWTSATGPVSVYSYTLTNSSDKSPTAWKLEGSNDGSTWTTLDEHSKDAFTWSTQTRPFEIAKPGTYTSYRFTFEGSDPVRLAEIELFASKQSGGDLKVSGINGLQTTVGAELNSNLATVTGGDAKDAKDLVVTADFLDGKGPQPATLTARPLGGWYVNAPHTFTQAGTYDVLISAMPAAGANANAFLAAAAATGVAQVTVTRAGGIAASYNVTCIGKAGETVDCDGNGWAYYRDKLADTGFVQGTTIPVPGTDLTFDLPKANAKGYDNVIPQGQTISLDLGTGATQLSFIGLANESQQSTQATLTYTDGSTDQVTITFGDWVGAATNPVAGNIVVGSSAGRLQSGGGDNQTAAVFSTKPFDIPAGKKVTSLTLSNDPGSLKDGKVHLFAVASNGQRTASSLAMTALDQQPATAGTPLTTDLAKVTGANASQLVSATVNWGDATAVSAATVTGDDTPILSGTHTYTKAGDYQVIVTVDDGQHSTSVTVPITVKDATPAYTPTLTGPKNAVKPGQKVTIKGEGFAAGESVDLQLATDPVQTATVTADKKGRLSAKFTIPETAADGTYPVTATGQVSKTPATVDVIVQTPTPKKLYLQLSTPTAHVGDAEQVLGSGFAPGEKVTLSLPDQKVTLATANADTSGGLTASFTVPKENPGTYTVLAHAASGSEVSATLTVVAGASPVNPTPTPGPTPPHKNKVLPWTGADVAWPIGGFAAAVLLGLGAVVFARRRAARR